MKKGEKKMKRKFRGIAVLLLLMALMAGTLSACANEARVKQEVRIQIQQQIQRKQQRQQIQRRN